MGQHTEQGNWESPESSSRLRHLKFLSLYHVEAAPQNFSSCALEHEKALVSQLYSKFLLSVFWPEEAQEQVCGEGEWGRHTEKRMWKGALERGWEGLRPCSLTVDVATPYGEMNFSCPHLIGEKFAARRSLSEPGIILLIWSRQPISVKRGTCVRRHIYTIEAMYKIDNW